MAYNFVSPERKVSEFSSLIAGNRLEPRPRSAEFNRSLRAEIRDAAWMLTRQWQMKEFRAEDRGSPIGAQVNLEHAPLAKIQLGDSPVTSYNPADLPLDALVQAQVPVVDVGLQLQMGRHWKRLLQSSTDLSAQVGQLITVYKELFPIIAPTNSASLGFAIAQSQPEALAVHQTATFRAIAGYDLYDWLENHPGLFLAKSFATNFSSAEQAALLGLADQFTAWYRRLYTIPANGGTSAWSVPALAYEFSAATTTPAGGRPLVVKATEHYGGELNWYTVDKATGPDAAVFASMEASPSAEPLHFVPTEIQFAGAPNARWWEFEDQKVDFGQISGDSSDLGRMLLQEFMFLYHNDWFSLPFTVPSGSLCSVTNLVVTDVFGERYSIQPAGQNLTPEAGGTHAPLDDDWGRWSLYALSEIGNRQRSVPRLFLPPTALNTQVGPVVEQVYFAREEATNLVWGVEKVVPDGLGRGTDGDSAAARVTQHLRSRATAPVPLTGGAKLEYKLATGVAENWIPFIPRPTGGLYELEQGTMLRHIDFLTLSAPDAIVHPRTTLLGQPANVPYLVHEREVPPTGMRLEGTYRRTRWYNGGAVLWYGRNRNVGRSGGSSGLAYDQLIPRP